MGTDANNKPVYEYRKKKRNLGDLCQLLNVSRYLLNKMLEESHEELGNPTGYATFSIHQVDILVQKYGIMPPKNSQE